MKKQSKKKKPAKTVGNKKTTAVKKKATPKKKKTPVKAKKKAKPVAKKKKAAPVKKKKVVAVKKKNISAPKAKPSAKTNKKEKFPGYPQYPASEDIMNKSGVEKVVLNDEVNMALQDKKIAKKSPVVKKSGKKKSNDVTQGELKLIGDDELNNDMGDDEELKKRVYPVDMSGEDLDVPGSELDDANEDIGEEDEENNSYSIGGDRHEDLEEDKDLGM
jgi:hypothetical protein